MSHDVVELPREHAAHEPTPRLPAPAAPLYPGRLGASVVARLLEVAAAGPDRPAACSGDDVLTYRELVEASGTVARSVLAMCRAGAPVAVLAEQTATAVAAAIGALRAGRPLVLLDPHLPDARLADVVERAEPTVVVADTTHADRARDLGRPVIELSALSALLGTGPEPSGTDELPEPAHGRAPATIVFTSGSTGHPKGVVLSHDTVVNGAALSGRAFSIDPGDQVALVLPYAFAAGQEILFMGLLNGATLHLHDPRTLGLRGLPRWLVDRGIRTLHTTPSLLRSIVGAVVDPLPRVRLVTACGEAVHGRDVEATREPFPSATFVSWLGATETGHLAFYKVPPRGEAPTGVVPAGLPVASKLVRVVDDSGEPLPPGRTGHVEVRSAFLASGYWRDPDGTRATFRPDGDGLTAVRTGDLGRIDDDGVLHLAGRGDHAVKVRGYLVEPAEVEAVLRSLPEIVDAVVVPRQVARSTDDRTETRLVAYAVPHPRRRTPSSAALRRHLRRSLPEWMVPGDLVLLRSLPRTERGKLDRAALPPPPERPVPSPPRGQWEVTVAEIWSTVLDHPDVGRESSFSELGGDSLAVEEMITLLEERLGVRTSTVDLAEHPTLRDYAAHLAHRVTHGAGNDRRAARKGGTLVRLRPDGDGAPVVCFSGAGGSAGLFAALAQRLDGDRPVLAFAVNGFENRGVPDWTVRAAARRYVRALGGTAPRPAALVGHSLGGLFALEVAHLLRDRGHAAPLVVLLDTVLPPSVAVRAGDEPPRVRVPGARQDQTRRELWHTRLRLLGAGLVDYDVVTRQEVFFQHGARLTRFHRPRTWDGPTLVVRTQDNIDDPSWWDALLTGPYDLVDVDCDHVGVLKDPHLDVVLDALHERLGHSADGPA